MLTPEQIETAEVFNECRKLTSDIDAWCAELQAEIERQGLTAVGRHEDRSEFALRAGYATVIGAAPAWAVRNDRHGDRF